MINFSCNRYVLPQCDRINLKQLFFEVNGRNGETIVVWSAKFNHIMYFFTNVKTVIIKQFGPTT